MAALVLIFCYKCCETIYKTKTVQRSINLTPRERVRQAIKRAKPDRVPKDIGLTPAVIETMKCKTGIETPEEFFNTESRNLHIAPMKELPDFSEYLKKMPPGTKIVSDYGIAHLPGEFYHFARSIFPMADFTDVQQVKEYPWPDYQSDYRYVHLADEAKKLAEQGYWIIGWAGHIFETAWQLTGYEKFMEYLFTKPDFVAEILDRITANNIIQARWMAKAGADMLSIGDDVAMQDRMMMSPATWREWFKPRHAAVIKAAKEIKPDIEVWYHSDGNVEPIIEDLIEIGLTVLNPVQPECMDVYYIKRKYGDRLAFWGTIGTQTVMPFGTPNDVKQKVKEMIELFAPGLIIAPTHVIEPDVPWENLVAFKEAIEEYGRLH
jgi:uroporphyrinogen decarboxylase